MISIVFRKKRNCLTHVEVSGHALFDEYGRDIVCAAVTSALMMCANGLTEILNSDCDILVQEDKVSITLKEDLKEEQILMSALKLHYENLTEDYKKNIKLKTMEV